jgi:hypothetical protein
MLVNLRIMKCFVNTGPTFCVVFIHDNKLPHSVPRNLQSRESFKQDMQYTHNVTLRRDRVTIVAMEIQQSFAFVFLTYM